MNCNCPVTQPGPTLASTCGGSSFMLFMGLLEVFIRSQCDLEDPCGRPESRGLPDREYDFIIVGGGSAGCVMASRLSEVPHWRILLIEVGGNEPTGTQVPSMFLNFLGTEIDWAYRTEPEDMACLAETDRRCSWPRGKMMKFLLPLLLIIHAIQCAEEVCPPKACEVRKYKCISQDSCNGTLVPRAAACGCCPGCKPYLNEGDACTVEEPGLNTTSATPSSGLVDINSVKASCRPEVLTCLSGICVSIY